MAQKQTQINIQLIVYNNNNNGIRNQWIKEEQLINVTLSQ